VSDEKKNETSSPCRRTVTDNADRNSAEDRLHAGESQAHLLAKLLEGAALPFAIGYPDGRIGIVNTAFCNLVGYSQDDLRAMDWSRDLTPPEWRTREAEHLEELLRTREAVRYEKEYIRKDGSRIPIELLTHLVCDETGTPQYFYAFLTDLTERKRAEETLRSERARAHQYLEIAGAILLALDLHGNVTLLNRKGYELLEYPEGELSGRNWVDTCLPERERSRLLADFQQLAAGNIQPVEHLENWVLTRTGRERLVAWHNSTIFDDAGTPVGTLSSGEDITERRQAQQELRLSQQRQKAILDTIPDPAWLKDAHGRFLALNAAWCKFVGLDVAEAVGKTALELLSRGGADRFQEEDRDILRTGMPLRHEEMLHDLDDRRVWFDTIKAPLRNDRNEIIGTVGIARDITDRKQVEGELRQANEHLRIYERLVEGSPNAFVVLDREYIYRMVNVAFLRKRKKNVAEVLGHSAEEVLGKEDFQRVRPYVEQAFQGKEVRFGDWFVYPDLGPRFMEISYYPLPDGNGQTTFIVVEIHDVTDRKRAEDEKLEMQQRLLHGQKLESLGVLAGGIAHDFNNLLSAIVGHLDVAMLSLPSGSPVRSNLEQSMLAARRAAALTRELLAYAGKGQFLVTQVDLSDLVEQNSHLLRTCIPNTISLDLGLARDLPTIETDAAQLQQVVMNILMNAAEAVGEQPGAVSLTTGAVFCDDAELSKSRVEAKPHAGQFVYVEVSDTGCGMDAETQRCLFDPFFSTKFAGRGLGMSAVLGIVRAHHGAIFVSSAMGRGTTVRVLFPAQPKPSSTASEECEPSAAQPTTMVASSLPGTVLIVDDDDLARSSCRALVESSGMHVLTAADGEEAIAVYRDHKDEIACILLDLTMPKKDGMDTLKELRMMGATVPIILVSGYGEAEATRKFAGLGLAGFMQKPFGLQDAVEEIRRAIGRKG
jgi:two-component system, cell cycle sensor histidine kinase and response regulator CckA